MGYPLTDEAVSTEFDKMDKVCLKKRQRRRKTERKHRKKATNLLLSFIFGSCDEISGASFVSSLLCCPVFHFTSCHLLSLPPLFYLLFSHLLCLLSIPLHLSLHFLSPCSAVAYLSKFLILFTPASFRLPFFCLVIQRTTATRCAFPSFAATLQSWPAQWR